MSDEESWEESESGEDFSASEEEWKPGKDDTTSEDDEIDIESASASNTDSPSVGTYVKGRKVVKPKVRKIAVGPKLNTSINRRHGSSLRSKLLRRSNSLASKSPGPSKLSRSKVSSSKVPKAKPSTSAILSDSESSDDGLVNPDDIDLNSDFFAVKKTSNGNQQPCAPTFDCNAGMQLSDSSDDDELREVPDDSAATKKPSVVDRINKKSSKEMHDFSSLQSFAKNLESAKAHLALLKEKEAKSGKNQADESDITKLLSLGEGVALTSISSRKRKHGRHSDDSDWENVSDDDQHGETEIKDIHITVGEARLEREKRTIDLEACLKRRMNRDIKEKQVYLHKTSVLCWTAHGNYINRVLNNIQLMEMCLKLLPSKSAYPKGDTDLKYFHMITDWFHTVFQLKSKQLYCDLKRLPPKTTSLALQIKSKAVICKCDFVLLFVTMLRAIGIQCRLVINYAVPPLRPPQKDLYVISSKSKAEEAKEGETKSKSRSLKTKSDSKAKKLKVNMSRMNDSFIRSMMVTPSNGKSPHKSNSHQHSLGSSKVDHSSPKVGQSSNRHRTETRHHATESNRDKTPSNFQNISFARQKTSTVKPGETSKQSIKSAEACEKLNHKHAKKGSKAAQSSQMASSSHINLSPMSSSKSLHGKKPTRQRDGSPKTGSKHSNESSRTLTGTPVKNKLIERTNSSNVLNAAQAKMRKVASTVTVFSPRKTRSKTSKADVAKPKIPQLDGAHDAVKSKKKTTKSRGKDEDEDSEYDSPPKHSRKQVATQKVDPKASAKIDRRVFSSDDEKAATATDADTNTDRMNFWIEAYAEKEKKWVSIDPVKKKVDCVEHIRKQTSKPIIYVFAWNNDNTIRDVTPRYCSHFHTTTRKLRAEQLWMDEMLDKLLENRNSRTIIEDVEFSKLQNSSPMPTSISEFKNHPLYALERHLLKFEAFYPPNALTLGFIREEPIYSRDCVHTLHSREIWVKQARTVKLGEKPYKIVKARPKWNRMLNQMEEAKPLEIFGFWQTEPYKPPVAENGVVPRNPYGNVELFKPEMLPIGTRHIQLPNLNRVCKKMGVDCAQAVIGFDFHSGSSHPTFDGFVVCEEFADDVIAQWEIDQDEIIRKEQEKREARVFGNWKKLIKGLLIRERLKRKFNFGAEAGKGHGGKRKKTA